MSAFSALSGKDFAMFFKKKKPSAIDMENLPKHIGVIMDGNGRWAKKRGLPRSAGHKAGADSLKKIVTACNKMGIRYITVYAFSTENWSRPKEEVDYLMNLLLGYLRDAENTLAGENVVIRAIGSRAELSEEIQEQIIKTEAFTANNTGIVMNIALNYGAREELTTAVRGIADDVQKGEITVGDISPELISSRLYTGGQPDPDLLIRTSGEIRLSNFMLWQLAYSEMYFTDKLWPDFTVRDLEDAIIEYQRRNRRFGGV
ncbi:MAG: isoprenyl transferase [Clostridia bacterium]|nr:isoprenyl transferase [Clostridia bacterium]